MSKEKTMLFMEQTKSGNFNSDKRGIFCIIAAAAIFGMMPICAKTIYAAGGNSWLLSFLRFSLALPLLALLNYKNPKKKKAFRMQKPLVRDILFCRRDWLQHLFPCSGLTTIFLLPCQQRCILFIPFLFYCSALCFSMKRCSLYRKSAAFFACSAYCFSIRRTANLMLWALFLL